MQRNKAVYAIAAAKAEEIKQRMLNWANQFSIFLFLDSNNYPSAYDGYECLLAADTADAGACYTLEQLQASHDAYRDWHFGHICYDYKNRLEPKLASAHEVKLGFPELYFFVPQTVCYMNRACSQLTIETFDDPAATYCVIMAQKPIQPAPLPQLGFTRTIDRQAYVDTIARLRRHIGDGDCYEINFCAEGFCENAIVEPLAVYQSLKQLSPAPFAAFYRLDDRYMMCASPERYLRKSGNAVLSQPIKGTARRDADPQIDEDIKKQLQSDIKERAENVMITDLVRNDLARCCETGSIKVDELFGIYTFPQVHQMMSTVSGRMKPDAPLTDVIRYSFPMGSMTGAPKYKVMQLIEHYERSRRELYSGTVGYITPHGNFDFNVIIRSLFYNASTRHLSYQTGGAITYDSKPEQEWEEMRLKAWALERIFAGG